MWATCRTCGHAWPYVPPDRYDDGDAPEASEAICHHCGHDGEPVLKGFDGVHRMVGAPGGAACALCGDTDGGTFCYGPDGFETA